MSRAVLETLRRASEPLTVKDITARIMDERGLNAADRGLVRSMVKQVDMALRYQRTNGVVSGVGGIVGWELTR